MARTRTTTRGQTRAGEKNYRLVCFLHARGWHGVAGVVRAWTGRGDVVTRGRDVSEDEEVAREIDGLLKRYPLGDGDSGRPDEASEEGVDEGMTGAEFPLLHRAVIEGSSRRVRSVLGDPEVDVNHFAVDRNYKAFGTPLAIACAQGRAEIVEALLEAPGIDPHLPGLQGELPLTLASREGHADVVRLLLRTSEIDVNRVGGKEGHTALVEAARNGHTDVVKLLTRVPGVDVNARFDDRAPLHWAVFVRSEGSVEALLGAPGIDVNVEGATRPGWEDDTRSEQFTALSTAAYIGHVAILKMLLAAPAIDVNKVLTLKWNDTTEDPGRSSRYAGREQVMWLPGRRTRMGAQQRRRQPRHSTSDEDVADGDAQRKPLQGETALLLAARKDNPEPVRVLLAVPGVEVNCVNKDGHTPLNVACRNWNVGVVELLVSDFRVHLTLRYDSEDDADSIASADSSSDSDAEEPVADGGYPSLALIRGRQQLRRQTLTPDAHRSLQAIQGAFSRAVRRRKALALWALRRAPLNDQIRARIVDALVRM